MINVASVKTVFKSFIKSPFTFLLTWISSYALVNLNTYVETFIVLIAIYMLIKHTVFFTKEMIGILLKGNEVSRKELMNDVGEWLNAALLFTGGINLFQKRDALFWHFGKMYLFLVLWTFLLANSKWVLAEWTLRLYLLSSVMAFIGFFFSFISPFRSKRPPPKKNRSRWQ